MVLVMVARLPPPPACTEIRGSSICPSALQLYRDVVDTAACRPAPSCYCSEKVDLVVFQNIGTVRQRLLALFARCQLPTRRRSAFRVLCRGQMLVTSIQDLMVAQQTFI